MRKPRFLDNLRSRSRQLKLELVALYYVMARKDCRLRTRILVSLALAYALSPVDLIPDFIPVIGYLDDLIIIPLLITLAIRTIPAPVFAECRAKAAAEPLELKKNWKVGLLFIACWLLAGVILAVWLIRWFSPK